MAQAHARLKQIMPLGNRCHVYYICKYFVRFLHEILKNWCSVALLLRDSQNCCQCLRASVLSISCRSRTSCSTSDVPSKQTGAVCVEEENGIKFFVLDGRLRLSKSSNYYYLLCYLFYPYRLTSSHKTLPEQMGSYGQPLSAFMLENINSALQVEVQQESQLKVLFV